jgi:hypothetical protein
VPYVRTVKTSSGVTAVQIVYSCRRGSRKIEHIGSAHGDAGLELLKAVARQRLGAGQQELDLGLELTDPARRAAGGGPLPITSTRMGHLWRALSRGHDELGFGRAAGGDEVFRQLVLARIIEPVSKLGSLRVLEEAGITPVSYATLRRRLAACAKEPWRQGLSAACAAHAGLGPASLVLYDVPSPAGTAAPIASMRAMASWTDVTGAFETTPPSRHDVTIRSPVSSRRQSPTDRPTPG